jgi:pyruvate decarboxylase
LPGALITTFGVGELSALNGIGGAYSEYVPIIHIVGTTARSAQKSRLMIHHTLAEDWDHTTLQDVSRPLCAASVFLTDDSTFTQEVDLVMEVCIKTRRPVYLYVPMDTPDLLVDASRLQNPLNVAITNPGREALEDSIVRKIIDEVERAERPCILVDALTQRFGLTDDVREMLRLTGLPVGGVPDQTPVTTFFTTVTVPNFS